MHLGICQARLARRAMMQFRPGLVSPGLVGEQIQRHLLVRHMIFKSKSFKLTGTDTK